MAKKSMIVKNEKRKALVAKFAVKRAALKAQIRDPKTAFADKQIAQTALQNLPRDSNPIRVRNRCVVTGRPRGYHRKFGMSRIALRELALRGELPGVTKASW